MQMFVLVKPVGAAAWKDIVGSSRRVTRGQSPCKPPLAQVLSRMLWLTGSSGETVGLLKHFFSEMGVKDQHPGQRARTLNKLLRQAGHEGRIREEELENRCGKKPWVAGKATFRILYGFL